MCVKHISLLLIPSHNILKDRKIFFFEPFAILAFISDVALQSELFPHARNGAVDLRHWLLYQRCSFDTSRFDVLHMLLIGERVKG